MVTPDPISTAQSNHHPSAAQAAPPVQQPDIATADAALADSAEPLVSIAEGPNASNAADTAPDPADADHDASQDAAPDAIPPAWSIPIKTGREAMQSRAVRLYSAVATSAGLSPMEMHSEGVPISVDKAFHEELCKAYMESDKHYQLEVAAHRAGEPVNMPIERRRAWDRARQEIGRAFGDLVSIYAADITMDSASGKKIGYRVYRLPDVCRRQIAHKAEMVFLRSGGGRMLVDGWGVEINRQHPDSTID